MENLEKHELSRRLEEIETELDEVRQTLETIPEGEDNGSTSVTSEEAEDGETIAMYVTKKDSSQITDEDMASLRRCARLKGFEVKDVVKDPKENES